MTPGVGVKLEKVENEKSQSSTGNGGPMDSPWPMLAYDSHHTSRGPYDSINNTGYVKWRFECDDVMGSSTIDKNGIIYFGDLDNYLYALYPNGTLKWKFKGDGKIFDAPALAEDGTIYIGTNGNNFYAINPNGTKKWHFKVGGGGMGGISTSATIAEDGTIYFGTPGGAWVIPKFFALYPNGTLKWSYTVGDYIGSTPAIGDDGTIYFGCEDKKFYALNQNGTLKWRREPFGNYFSDPVIGEDGTIFISSSGYLFAYNPNGTQKWGRYFGNGCAGPCIGEDGTLYVVSHRLFGLYPSNGTTKYESDFKTRPIYTPAMSADGIIYFCTSDMEYLFAAYSDCTEKWRRKTPGDYCWSGPSIDKDGTVYIGTYGSKKNFHAYGDGGEVLADANGPYYGLMDIPLDFVGHADYGYYPYTWYWDFDDGHTSDEQNPTHIYDNPGNYSVTLTVTDKSGNISEDSTFAWIQYDNRPPNDLVIDGPGNCIKQKKYKFNFTAEDPEDLSILYYISWGDGTNTGWIGPYKSGRTINLSHSWWAVGEYNVRFKAKDPYNVESECVLKVTIPRTRTTSYHWLWERFPLLERLLSFLLL